RATRCGGAADHRQRRLRRAAGWHGRRRGRRGDLRLGQQHAGDRAERPGRPPSRPRRSLGRLVPERLGLTRPLDVTYALYRGRLSSNAIRDLAPLVFEAAGEGDAVARFIIDQQADEVVVMAVAALRQARALRAAVPVVLAGGIFRTTDASFHARIRAGLAAAAPRAEVCRLEAPPV